MCVGSCGAFYSFAAKKAQGLAEKRAAQLRRTALPGLGTSELEAQAELHATCEVSTAGMQEARASDAARVTGIAADRDRAAIHAAVNTVVLRMVEKVEILPAEIEGSRFREREALEKAEIEVDAAGTVQSVAAHVTEGQPDGSSV